MNKYKIRLVFNNGSFEINYEDIEQSFVYEAVKIKFINRESEKEINND